MSIQRAGWTRAAARAAALCGVALCAFPLPAFAGGPLDWYNAFNRQLGIGWSDGYHAKGRGAVYAEPDWQTLPSPAPAAAPQPAPAKQPAAPLDESLTRAATPARPALWSISPFFTPPTAPAEPYPTTKHHSIVAPAPPPAAPPAAPAVQPQPAFVPPPTYRAPPLQAAPPAPRPAPPAINPPSTFGGFYPEEMPAP